MNDFIFIRYHRLKDRESGEERERENFDRNCVESESDHSTY